MNMKEAFITIAASAPISANRGGVNRPFAFDEHRTYGTNPAEGAYDSAYGIPPKSHDLTYDRHTGMRLSCLAPLCPTMGVQYNIIL